jgi:glycosyltransferase involved in cell wall biosynthesis
MLCHDKNTKTILSIIVPVYKMEAYLRQCVNSILEQAYNDFELILVDDGSPDDCGAVCDEYADKDDRIVVIHKQNGGLSDARNAGLDRAKGKYITFVDSDDHITPDSYKENMEIMEKNPEIDILTYPIWVHFGAQDYELYYPPVRSSIEKRSSFAYWIHYQENLHAYCCNKIFRRELFDDIRFPKGRHFEDIYTMPQLVRKARMTYGSAIGTYYYVQTNTSITSTANWDDYDDLLDANLNIWNMFPDSEVPKEDQLIFYLMAADLQICAYRSWGCKTKLPHFHFTLSELFRLPVSRHVKMKNITLCLFGVKAHCFLWYLPATFRKSHKKKL